VNKKIYYQCFSKPEKEFLYSKGMDFLLVCRHWQSLKPMWIFLYDNDGKLDEYLEQWKTVRKINYEGAE
jgi:hypothetical protein